MMALERQGGDMFNVVAQAAVALVAWFILMLVCTNLIGFLVRGLVTDPEMEKTAAGDDFLAQEFERDQRASKIVNVVALALLIVFLVFLYKVWNIGLVFAAILLIAARTPDLIWEIKYGRRLQLSDVRRPRFYILTTIFSWVSLPMIWYALYRM